MYVKERGGATRVVLGRELSAEEIKSITLDIERMGEDEVEVEASCFHFSEMSDFVMSPKLASWYTVQ